MIASRFMRLANVIQKTLFYTNRKHGALFKFLGRILRKTRTILIKRKDPLVDYQVGGMSLAMNLSHDLPFILEKHPFYAFNLSRIAAAVQSKYPRMTSIDIGANIGDSVAILRTSTKFPILCIEGDDKYLGLLKKNTEKIPDVFIQGSFLGEATATIKASVISENGTARIDRMASDEEKRIVKLDDIIERWEQFQNPKMVKIDTDGYEAKILKGAQGLIARSKPVIFFEYDPYFLGRQNDDNLLIFDMLRHNGYQNAMVYLNTGEFMLTANLENEKLLEELHLYFSGRKGRMYCDICAFHQEDDDLWSRIRASEISFFQDRAKVE